MSEKYTAVQVAGTDVLLDNGHVTYAEAVASTRAHYERERARADSILASMAAGDVTVHHQRGIHIVRDRKLVEPEGPS